MPNTQSAPYCYQFPHPAVTADCVVFGFDGQDLQILLVQRGNEPYKGSWALPGGFMNMDETLEECALRELNEETSLKVSVIEQFHAFSKVDRDPRERVLTVAFIALVRSVEVKGGDDAKAAKWFSVNNIPTLAFDHQEIISKAKAFIKERIRLNHVEFDLFNEEFTNSKLQMILSLL